VSRIFFCTCLPVGGGGGSVKEASLVGQQTGMMGCNGREGRVGFA
jgi:hypothetical protein